MSRVHHIELQCEIDPLGESIHGEMNVRQGKSLPFSGWTEFATTLVSLTSAEREEIGDARSLAEDGSQNSKPSNEEK